MTETGQTDTPPAPQRDRRFAETLARGLAVLRAFRASDDGLGNGEIAERTGLPKSTVSRLTFTLQSLGYLTHAGRHDLYRPGPALLALGNVAAASITFVEIAGPIMQRLADETGTLALMLVRDGRKMLIVRTWRPRGVSSLWLEVGHRVPFNGSSSGHAMLAAMDARLFRETLAAVDGDRGLTRERAEAVRRHAWGQLLGQGYVLTDPGEYFAPSIHAVARPFRSRDLSEPVIFTCGALPQDLSVERMREDLGPRLAEAVEDLERIMGQGSSLATRD
ncbi:IclR family transcriptional regulator [Roseivivax sediminis]|uniref:DNA-binding transcriptional regulator, IclR family n=1 Tax=Roseivivax sediminis TaxID=936889 RepID=A0A1I2C229_9RHOB|nr:IclR family transcriptional regulator [Roseivivax sediminis]SFE62496.1 DNA-binding transcriptional regulator, IclR family [Roseivivax sediminis]